MRGTPVAIDPVCKMEVEESKAAATSDYKGKKYYFYAVDIQAIIFHNVKGGINYEYYPNNF